MVVVVEQIELAESEVARERGCLTRDTFHQVPVAHKSPDPVIDDSVFRTVEPIRQQPLGDGHPNCVAEALAQGSGGRLDSRSMSSLRVARRARAPLAERLE